MDSTESDYQIFLAANRASSYTNFISCEGYEELLRQENSIPKLHDILEKGRRAAAKVIADYRQAVVKEETIPFVNVNNKIIEALTGEIDTSDWGDSLPKVMQIVAAYIKRFKLQTDELEKSHQEHDVLIKAFDEENARLSDASIILLQASEAIQGILTDHSDGDMDAVSVVYDNMVCASKVTALSNALAAISAIIDKKIT